jgi:hypothetical protein
MFMCCSLNDTTTDSILEPDLPVSLHCTGMDIALECLLGKNKVRQNFPQTASKILPTRDIRRS